MKKHSLKNSKSKNKDFELVERVLAIGQRQKKLLTQNPEFNNFLLRKYRKSELIEMLGTQILNEELKEFNLLKLLKEKIIKKANQLNLNDIPFDITMPIMEVMKDFFISRDI